MALSEDNMRKVSTKGYQKHLLHKDLLEQLNPEDPLLKLARKIDWIRLEETLAPLYSKLAGLQKTFAVWRAC